MKPILKVVHESAKSLYEAGLMDVVTMHEFDSMCLSPVKKLSPTEIKKIRLREKLSQPVFAHVLNVSSAAVKQWEIGEKHPGGAALKLLNLVAEKGVGVVISQN
jgi:putative transcriptional regulator